MKKWYEKPLFIIALQGGTGKKDFLEVPGILENMGFNTEQGTKRPGTTNTSLETSPESMREFKKYLKEIRKSGMKFILYLNTHVLAQPEKYREWAQQAEDGTFPKLYDTSYAVCLNSSWREYFFKKLEEYADCDIDGVFLDGPSMIRGGCFCPRCRARFLKEYKEEMTGEKERFEFYRDTQDDFFKEAYKRFKKLKPEGLFYMNFNLFEPAGSYHSLPEGLEYNDMVGTEAGFQFFSPPREINPWRVSFMCKLLESSVPDRARVNFIAADQKPWSHYMHTPVETKLCITATAANGANIWYGPHSSIEILDTPGGRAAVEIIRFLNLNKKYYESTESAARVAVMHSFATGRYYRTLKMKTDFYGQKKDSGLSCTGNFTSSLYGFCSALARSGIPYDVVTDLDYTIKNTGRYDCIFLPTCACLSDNVIKHLEEFVSEGGVIAATLDTSLFDETGKRRNDFGLRKLLGVSFANEIVGFKNWNYISTNGKDPVFKGIDIPLLPAPDYALKVIPDKNAEVVAHFHEPMAGRYEPLTPQGIPAIVINKFNKGRAIYFSGTFGEMMNSYSPPEYRKMVANIAEIFAGNPVSLKGGINIEVVLRKQEKRMILHLINYAGLVPRPFESMVPRHNLEIKTAKGNYERAFALAGKKGCSFSLKDGELNIKVDTLKDYEVIVLE